jgi:hypothetical protein
MKQAPTTSEILGAEQGATNIPSPIRSPAVPYTTWEGASVASSQGLGEGAAVQGGDGEDDDGGGEDDDGGGEDDDGDDDGGDDEGDDGDDDDDDGGEGDES